jgi:hypothetical protein
VLKIRLKTCLYYKCLLKSITRLYKSSISLNIKDALLNELLIYFKIVLNVVYITFKSIKCKILVITSFKLKAYLLN